MLLLVAFSVVAGLLIAPRWGTSAIDLLFLLPVLAAASSAGLAQGLVAAVVSALAFNFFFTAPYHTFAIHSPSDIVTVIMLFVVAAVCSHLAASVRRQAQLASVHAARNATIAGFARSLLPTRDEAGVAAVAASRLAEVLACHVIVMTGTDAARPLASVPPNTVPGPDDLAAATFTLQSGEKSGRGQTRAPQVDWQFHPITSGDSVLAAIGLARGDGAPPVPEEQHLLFESLLNQLALALERARLEDDARDAAALRARDKLRSALLTSIGDDIKPRLKALQASVRSLKRGGTSDRVVVADLDGELNRVERHIDNLVDLTPGHQDDAIAFGEVTIDLHRRTVSRSGEVVHLTPKEFSLLAELTKHGGRVLTHAQLLRAVWGPAQQDHIDYLRVAVRALRLKLERDPARPQLIVNEPGIGYRLMLE